MLMCYSLTFILYLFQVWYSAQTSGNNFRLVPTCYEKKKKNQTRREILIGKYFAMLTNFMVTSVHVCRVFPLGHISHNTGLTNTLLYLAGGIHSLHYCLVHNSAVSYLAFKVEVANLFKVPILFNK